MSLTPKRILWTVDPFAKDKALQRSAARAIKNITQGSQITIEPVYFFSAYLSGEYPTELPENWVHQVKTKGQKELTKLLHHIDLPGLKPLHVISEPFLSIREGIDRINRIAKKWRAEFIVTSTHARKGIKRLFLGSFAETLLLHSQVPLFFVNPHWKQPLPFKDILFPTDFSEESKEAFRKVLPLAQTLKCDISLFHKLSYVWPPTVSLSLEAVPLYNEVFNLELQAREQDAAQWAEEANARGVHVDPIVDSRQGDSVADAILRISKKKHGLIAMASRSGPLKTTLLGSTTRKMVRESHVPVWVLHPTLRVHEGRDNVRPLYTISEDEIQEQLSHPSKSDRKI